MVPLFGATSTIWGECDDGPFSPSSHPAQHPLAGELCWGFHVRPWFQPPTRRAPSATAGASLDYVTR